MPSLADVASEKLDAFTQSGRLRVLHETVRGAPYVSRDGRELISFACNDYLGLSQDERVIEAAVTATRDYGAGAGASRLVTGSHPLYAPLEARLAAWKKAEAALVFGSGYLANTGIIPALMGKEDLILADKLVHACLIDGARLSGAKFLRFKHNDLQDCERLLASHHAHHRHILIVTDEIFSMDGDVAPLAGLRILADAYDAWLMADSAHALTPCPVKLDVAMGTLSKALGAYGGFVTGSRTLIALLTTTARSFVFSTGLPPATIAAADAALRLLMEDESLAQMPLKKALLFTRRLGLADAQSHIVPLIVHTEAKALAASAELEQAGYFVAAIRPPTVPEGTSRLRFTFSALHRDGDIMKLADFIRARGWV